MVVSYDFEGLVEGVFLERLNRFVALVKIGNQELKVHVANSGRLRELLNPGVAIFLVPGKGKERKTPYDLSFVYKEETLVCIDSRIPNLLLKEAFQREDRIFPGYSFIKSEPSLEGRKSRLDFLLSSETNNLYVEAKSVTLVNDEKVAMFPDAPTERGVKHLRELKKLVEDGQEAAVIFLVQRNDALSFKPNDQMDPSFGQALRAAHNSGVLVKALFCDVYPSQVILRSELPIYLQE